jgi:hypothetical protein
MTMTVTSAVDHVDFIIPVDSMPEGEQIFGNFVINDEGVSSFVAYSMNVSDCAEPVRPLPGTTPVDSATFLPIRHLMIDFQFEHQVL